MAARGTAKHRNHKRNGDTGPHGLELRAAWILSHWRADNSLRYSQMRAMIMENFKISRNGAESAIARMYQILADEAKQQKETAYAVWAARLEHIWDKAAASGNPLLMYQTMDRAMKFHGLGEPEQVHVTGGTITQDDAAMLEALKLTPAQRANAIKKLQDEIAATAKAKAESEATEPAA